MAKILMNDKTVFNEIATYWTYYFAMSSEKKAELDAKKRFEEFNGEFVCLSD